MGIHDLYSQSVRSVDNWKMNRLIYVPIAQKIQIKHLYFSRQVAVTMFTKDKFNVRSYDLILLKSLVLSRSRTSHG